MLSFKNREELAAYIASEVIDTSEALEILDCSRQNLYKFVKTGKLIPIKEFKRDKLFFKRDVLVRKEEAARYNQKSKE